MWIYLLLSDNDYTAFTHHSVFHSNCSACRMPEAWSKKTEMWQKVHESKLLKIKETQSPCYWNTLLMLQWVYVTWQQWLIIMCKASTYHTQTIRLDEGSLSHRFPVLWSCDWVKQTDHIELNNFSEFENKTLIKCQLFMNVFSQVSHWNKLMKYCENKQACHVYSTYIFTS